jgi:hypothetical protein
VLDRCGLIRFHAMAVRHAGAAWDVLTCGQSMLGRGCKRDGRHHRNAKRHQYHQKPPYFVLPSTCHDAG